MTFKTPRLRLHYLDGLRGLAALFVVFHHTYLEITYQPTNFPYWFYEATKIFTLRYAVDVFIVLSGYCLMLPVVRSPDKQLAGGTGSYLVRRARRILPPYYAALIFSLALILLIPDLQRYTQTTWDCTLPNLAPVPIITHLLLIHNLNPHWTSTIDAPMWSVATEWQIYFFFPLLLLPVWRKFGAAAAATVGYLLGVGLYLATGQLLNGACPWYIGLFAMGMAAVDIGFSQNDRARRLNQRVPWGWLIFVFSAALAISIKLAPFNLMLTDLWAGLASMALLIFCTRKAADPSRRRFFVLRICESGWAAVLGAMSYSLYLIHYPIIAATHAILRHHLLMTPMRRLCLLPLICIPASLLIAYVFHLAFERPFLAKRQPAIAPIPPTVEIPPVTSSVTA